MLSEDSSETADSNHDEDEEVPEEIEPILEDVFRALQDKVEAVNC